MIKCNVCDDSTRTTWNLVDGGASVQTSGFGNRCPRCGSRPRIRAMVHAIDTGLTPLMTALGLAGHATALLVAPTLQEKTLLSPLLGAMTTTSLFGDYGAQHVISDISNLKEFEDHSFDFVEVNSVLDFVPDTDRAFVSISRVLRRRAVFFFHINDGRIKDTDDTPKIRHYRTDFSAEYYPKDYKQPVMIFGRGWIGARLSALGFQFQEMRWTDPGVGKRLTWWVAWRE
jgi:SAM-dependent methyltransferase